MAADDSCSITTLLRKALIVASKLNLEDLKKWINNELNGYEDTTEVPQYRRIIGELKSWNPYNGIWVPIIWEKMPEGVNKRPIAQPISEIVDILNNKNTTGILTIPFQPEQTAILLKFFDAPTPPVLVISSSQLVGIIDAVRNLVLTWSLKLETEGILGEGMTFTKKEKEKAVQNSEIKINNFQGILGDVINSTVSQEVSMSVKTNDLESLIQYFKTQGIDSEDVKELKEAITEDPKPKNKNNFCPKISKWIGKMVQKASTGAWEVGVAASGRILANAICAYYGI